MKKYHLILLFVFSLLLCALSHTLAIKAYGQDEVQTIVNKLCPPGVVHMRDSWRQNSFSAKWDMQNSEIILFDPVVSLPDNFSKAGTHNVTPSAIKFANICMILIPPEQQKAIIGTPPDDSPLLKICNLLANKIGLRTEITPAIVKQALFEISKACGMQSFIGDVLKGLPDSTVNRGQIKQYLSGNNKPCRDARTNNPCQ
jgi:hypothetical protein